MLPVCNFSELAAYSTEGFSKQEILTSKNGSTTTTTIYAGKAPLSDPSASTDVINRWTIRKTVVIDNGSGTTNIVVTWAQGSWTNRASLTYEYQ